MLIGYHHPKLGFVPIWSLNLIPAWVIERERRIRDKQAAEYNYNRLYKRLHSYICEVTALEKHLARKCCRQPSRQIRLAELNNRLLPQLLDQLDLLFERKNNIIV